MPPCIFFAEECFSYQNFAYFCNGFSRSLTKRSTEMLKYHFSIKSIRLFKFDMPIYCSQSVNASLPKACFVGWLDIKKARFSYFSRRQLQ